MSQKTSKLLRKIAKFTHRTDNFIKKEFKQMDRTMQRAYLAYMQESFKRMEEVKKNPSQPKDTVALDHPLPQHGN